MIHVLPGRRAVVEIQTVGEESLAGDYQAHEPELLRSGARSRQEVAAERYHIQPQTGFVFPAEKL